MYSLCVINLYIIYFKKFIEESFQIFFPVHQLLHVKLWINLRRIHSYGNQL